MNIIELKNINKTYPGSNKKANNDISLDLKKGEILCIAGENGAGKSTLMKILCGLEKPDTGEIIIDGKKTEINSPVSAKKLGIGMVHQHFMLFPEFTVAENIAFGTEPRKMYFFYDSNRAKAESEKIISGHNFRINSDQKVKDLTIGQMQQVEICRILNRNAQIIILDEPTSVLSEYETNSLFGTIRKLADNGKSIVLITHKINEIKKICDRVAVMRRGELVGVRETDKTDEYEIAGMIMGDNNFKQSVDYKAISPSGRNAAKLPAQYGESSGAVIEFKNVTVRRRGQKNPLLDKVSFSVSCGEILGFAGVGGNGLGVIEAVFGGFLHPAEGSVFHNGKDISALSIRALRKEGLAYVPADRIRVGSAIEATIEENLIINFRNDFRKKTMEEFSSKLTEKYNIQTPGMEEKAAFLSGGNLQKLILAREISCLKDYIVFSEPTWGLDIASGNFIMREITELRNKGAAVILISTNLDEILALSNRIIVMYRGRIAANLENTFDETIKEQIGNYMHLATKYPAQGLKASE